MKIYVLISIAYDEDRGTIPCITSRGFFETSSLALDTLAELSDVISEGGYFNYVLIEERDTNVLDGHSTSEQWYRLRVTAAENIIVEQIEKPAIFDHISNFS